MNLDKQIEEVEACLFILRPRHLELPYTQSNKFLQNKLKELKRLKVEEKENE